MVCGYAALGCPKGKVLYLDRCWTRLPPFCRLWVFITFYVRFTAVIAIIRIVRTVRGLSDLFNLILVLTFLSTLLQLLILRVVDLLSLPYWLHCNALLLLELACFLFTLFLATE
jgi:hypothetical protein